jgi:hypothetical protein
VHKDERQVQELMAKSAGSLFGLFLWLTMHAQVIGSAAEHLLCIAP